MSSQVGPIKVFLLSLPKLPAAGVAKALGLYHSLIEGFDTHGLAITFGNREKPHPHWFAADPLRS
jgi:hypothetical protein